MNENRREEEEIRGLFVFSFYVPGDTLDPTSIYLQGISMYVNAIQKPEGVFKNWKVLLYTDQPSYKLVKDYFPEETVEFCIVEWPYYTTSSGKVHGGIQRVMRFRSFFDFPSIPVFVRDADTVFADDHKGFMIKKDVYAWEADFLQGAKKHPNTWIFGTSLLYYLPHHKDQNKKLYSPLGPFAGFQSIMPTVPCFQSKDLWAQAIQYIIDDTKRIVETNGKILFSNNDDFHKRTGKDERILSFIFLQTCGLKNVFFFELDMASFRKVALEGKIYLEDDYPSSIFQRGSNTNVQKIFDQAIQNHFTKNRYNEIRGQRVKIETELQNFNNKRRGDILKYMKTFKNKDIEFTNPSFLLSRIRFFNSEIPYVYQRLEEQQEKIKVVYDDFRSKDDLYDKAIKALETKLAYTKNVSLTPNESEVYQRVVTEKDEAAKKFVDTVLSMYSKDSILKLVGYLRRSGIETLLDFKAPPPTKKVTLASLASLLGPRKGGTRKRKHRQPFKNLKSRKRKSKA